MKVKCFESDSHWQDEASTCRGAQLFRSTCCKTARGDDDCPVVQDDASFSTLGANKVATESRQVSEFPVQPVLTVQSSVASAAPAHFSDIGACWHGLTAGGGAL